MSMVLHVSDPHFGTEQAPVVEALVRLAAAQRPTVVVLSGDITQRARPGQFQAARAFADRLGAPVLTIPGNHDIPLFALFARVFDPHGRQRAAFGRDLEPVFESPEWLVLCVNTTRAWRHKNGEISAAQVERVAARLERARRDPAGASQLRVVVVHQPIEVFRAEDVHDRLLGHDRALVRWAAAGADIVMGGHIHMPYVLALREGLARPLWVVQAGTSVSSRVREGVPNSVNLLRWVAPAAGAQGRRCAIEQWDYAAASDAFERARVTAIDPCREADGR
jgi:3',5'-cyclic AMP phosphodiesterase CpdA